MEWWQEFSVSVPWYQFSVGFSQSVLNGFSQPYTQMSHGVREIKMANSAEVLKKSYLKFCDGVVLPLEKVSNMVSSTADSHICTICMLTNNSNSWKKRLY